MTSIALPEFTIIDNLPAEVNIDHAHEFMVSYRQHCQSLLDVVAKQAFPEVEKLLNQFWQNLPSHFRPLLVYQEFVDQLVFKDHITYKAMAHALLPNVLQALPASIPQAIRLFARQLEPWVILSLEELPHNLIEKKHHFVRRFCQSLHRQASLNHLTQAARAVLQNSSEVSQMIVYWNRLDFEYIKEHAAWICGCGEEIIDSARDNFRRFLTERSPLESWTNWIQETVLKMFGRTNDPKELIVLAQQLLLKWSFVSTLIIRDLTICNASSFGSFHLLRTLFDEYLFYLVEPKLVALGPFMFDGNSSMSNVEGPPLSGVDSFSLDSLISKNNLRMGKHLPYPFHSEMTHTPDEEFGRSIDVSVLPDPTYMGMPGLSGVSRQGAYGYLKSREDLRMANLKRPAPDMKEAVFSSYEFSRSFSGVDLMQQSTYRDSQEQEKKMRLDTQTAEVK